MARTIKPLTTLLAELVPAPPTDENHQLRGEELNASPGPGISPLEYLRATSHLRAGLKKKLRAGLKKKLSDFSEL